MRINLALFASLGAVCACQPFEHYVEPPEPAPTCCGGAGVCVYGGTFSAESEERLSHAECAEPLVCAPLTWLLDPGAGPESCRTAGDLEGRCLPACLPELAGRQVPLDQQSCEAGYVCAPCFDPATGEDTQACHFDSDPGPADARGSAREQDSGAPPAPETCCERDAGPCLARTRDTSAEGCQSLR